MSLARTAYELATTAAQPLLGLAVRRRLKHGKEVAGRTGERFARTEQTRPKGPLVWMHGASIGETRLLVETAQWLIDAHPGLHILFTSQTTTSAELVAREIDRSVNLKAQARHQFAPLDTPAIARRFVNHWSPDLAIFAEGEIWPNLLKQLRQRDVPTALINARMTEKSLKGWSRWPALSQDMFGRFDVLLAADRQTAAGLSGLLERHITMPGNLKSALALPEPDAGEAAALSEDFIAGRPCLVAVSTHEGEEAFVLDALQTLTGRTACIIVPRHPERAGEIVQQIEARGHTVSRRSQGDRPTSNTEILLADTLGEVALFASLADTVYLGGGHSPGVGGHNPLEILRLGKPVATGPEVFNFADINAELAQQTGYTIVETPDDLAQGFPFDPPSTELMERLESRARAPMETTIEALLPLLPREASG